MLNPIAELHKRQREKSEELKRSGFVFSPAVNPDELSIGEINDLLALVIGESTFTDQDVKRIA